MPLFCNQNCYKEAKGFFQGAVAGPGVLPATLASSLSAALLLVICLPLDAPAISTLEVGARNVFFIDK